ncbi:group II truncated hemoglobin [Nocardioides mangrovi]|uniref:Group II truncated hemoglobin n=1 Tax=Nocardioides mangrovi TaxID=2874580 RepID=A0ABS7UJN0_9ACTN|nr:group II truncated hemoglobin [Nocardioides mangrovi]MBZ5741229.1 group II truncated hemoglobin [Nocardioides mangrovi]
MGVDEPGLPTLYDWAGGGDAVRRFIDAFYDRVERDDLLAGFFPGGVHEDHRAHVAAWWSEVLGGPATYTAEHGGYEAMLAHHRDLAITPEQRHRFASTMSLALDDAGLPDDPEFRAAVIGYVEWGTRLAMHNSRPGAADVVEHAPVPRWGWGVAPPYRG